jgi:hypothetical protein
MIATIVIAAATCVYVYFAGQQWATMSGQLAQMQSSSSHADSLIDKTKTLAENAGKQAANTEILANAAKDQVSKLKLLVRTANEQSKAMNQQLVTMQKQLEMTDRPWIKVDLKTIGPLRFINENAQFDVPFRITMKNIGRSVATKVRWRLETFLIRDMEMFQEPLRRQKVILDKLASTKPDPLEESESIFPDDERMNASSAGAAVTVEAFNYRKSATITNILPFVVGCVEYQFASSADRHYTCFNYRIVRPGQGIIHVGEDLPAESVFLDPNNWGGQTRQLT